MDELGRILREMDPNEAADAVATAVKDLLPLLEEEERRTFIEKMLGEPGHDKVVGMVHL